MRSVLVTPGFRSPPRLVGVQRSIKRWTGGATVAVVVRGRPWPAVQSDLIEGIIAANRPGQPGRRSSASRAVAGSRERRRQPVDPAPPRRGGLTGTVTAMRSWRLLASRLAINEVDVEVAYADVFVVLREGDDRPGPNDWEATVRTN